MATNTGNSKSGRTVTPPVRVKRERSEEEEPTTRRVSQRTEGDDANSIVSIVSNDLQSDDEEILGKALGKLAVLLYDVDDAETEKKQKLFYQVGGHAFVVALMKKYPDFVTIQREGVFVLMNTTYKNQELKIAVAVVNGIETILAAMKKFPSEQSITNDGLGTFCNFTSETDDHAESLVSKLDVLPFLISQMNRFSGHADITESACKLLNVLSSNAQLRDSIRDAKAMTVLAAALDNHKEEKTIQDRARKVLKRLLGD